MDFKNVLQKNVGNMKNKIPPMPNIPKLPKLKSRKIFNRSNENVSNDNNFATSQLSIGSSTSSRLQPPALPASSIINRSPSRISTISSLVEGGQQIEYNISESVGERRNRRRIRFDDNNDTNNAQQKSNICFTERLTKHYKELSEFKFSHIFGKKTIVQRTEIQVDMYKRSFEDQNSELTAERRMSRDYEFEFRSIPAGINSSADEPHSPTAPSVQSVSRTPSTSFGFQQESNIRTTNLNEIKSDVVSTPPPLSRRKAFNSNDELSTPPNGESPKQQKQTWKINSFKKKSMETNGDGDEGTIKSKPTDKTGSGIWQLRRPKRMPSSQDSVDNSDVTDFKKSLNNMLKKLPSLSSFDEPSENNSKSPKKPGMWKLQRPARVKVSTENIDSEANATKDSEFMKQFNKIVGKSSKIKKIMNKDSSNPTTVNVAQENVIEDPSKVKTMEEIEAFGYGRKNLKYISMWKVRRRREIRRNEPFPINRTNGQEEDTSKTPGMWQLRRPTRITAVINEGESIENAGNPQLAEITKSLMNLFKRNQNSVEPTTADCQNPVENKRGSLWKKKKIGATLPIDDEFADTDMNGNHANQQSGSSVQSRMWKFRQAIGSQSIDTDENLKVETENKTGFWKTMSQKRESKKDENYDANDESVRQKPRILDKAKKQISHINLKQLRSLESNDSQQGTPKNKNIAPKIQNSVDSFESFDSYDHGTLEDLARINRNLSWNRQMHLSNAFSSDSDEEDVITTPGFLQNQPVSVKCEIEPTIIIVSKPVPSILQYESIIQQQRLYPTIPIELPPTPPPSTPPPLPKTFKHLELPHPLVLPTPPPPKRQITPPSINHQVILSPPQSPTPPSQSPSPPLLPTSLPPDLSPPTKSLPPLPTSPRPQVSTAVTCSTVLQSPCSHLENRSRYRHSRKPSMDSNDSESWIPDNSRNRNVLELNKIEETFEQWNSVIKPNTKDDSLKKWKSIDIFNGNDQIFDDFDDELKNEPIITIAERTFHHESVSSSVKNNSEHTQPSGVPVTFEKHKITRPLVKQGSLRRQFSEEKDAEDLNKKRNVNKMISRFDPERGSSRRSINRDRIPITIASIELKDNKQNKDKRALKDDTAAVSTDKPKTVIGNLREPSSLDVEIDKNDLQLMTGSTSEDDSDNSDFLVQHIPVRPPTVLEIKPALNKNNLIMRKPLEKTIVTVERKLAPQPPSSANTTAPTTKPLNNNQNLIRRQIADIENNQRRTDDRLIIQDQATIIKSVKDSNENISNLNIKKGILQSRQQQSEDNFYSLDYTEEDETIQKYPQDGMNLVKEEYSIEL